MPLDTIMSKIGVLFNIMLTKLFFLINSQQKHLKLIMLVPLPLSVIGNKIFLIGASNLKKHLKKKGFKFDNY